MPSLQVMCTSMHGLYTAVIFSSLDPLVFLYQLRKSVVDDSNLNLERTCGISVVKTQGSQE
jgi:hypothetical protein